MQTNKEIMAEPLRLLKGFREALGNARTELRKKALAEMVEAESSSSKILERVYDHEKDLDQVNNGMDVNIQRLYKVSDDGLSWVNYNENGEK